MDTVADEMLAELRSSFDIFDVDPVPVDEPSVKIEQENVYKPAN
jgi:hypothetical protein